MASLVLGIRAEATGTQTKVSIILMSTAQKASKLLCHVEVDWKFGHIRSYYRSNTAAITASGACLRMHASATDENSASYFTFSFKRAIEVSFIIQTKA